MLLQLVIYCIAIVAASLLGGWLPIFVRLTHARLQVAISFVSGLMLGVGLLHMLPHAIFEAREAGFDHPDRIILWLLAGFLVMFLLERFFCFHHHDAEHVHAHEHSGETSGDDHGPHQLTWSGGAIGLTLHSLLAGVALAASVQAQRHDGDGASLAGLGTFLVIVLHKPFDSMTLGTLLAVGKWPARMRHVVNGLFAMAVPLGVAAFCLGFRATSPVQSMVLAYSLAFSAGTFLCIAMSDLLPELQFHSHDRVKLTAALLLGLALAWTIGLFETTGHEHYREAAPASAVDRDAPQTIPHEQSHR